MVNIDQELCIGCRACEEDCVGDVIIVKDGKAEVTKRCIECGHCVALCPVCAVSIPEYDMDDVEEYHPGTFHVNPENMLHAVKFRRSIRRYKPAKIEKDKAGRILDAGRYSATAKNQQGCSFTFVQDGMDEFRKLVWEVMPSIVERLKKEAPLYGRVFGLFYSQWKANPQKDKLLFNAPAFLVITSDNQLDGGIAAANIENVAAAEGVGALYNGYMMRIISKSPELKEWLGIGDKPVACCMLLGYPAVTYLRTAPRKKGDIIWK